ncbi:MAG: aminotransferase class I/II-fold pyridoxal phosphate-dependent enzyme [Gammaproteobacteria bacterium]|nr:aminotransferase class I/II-fold pyridoxal phosphate-dependent enzyme [Gammaproteobacteria bacterium]
MTTKLRQLSPLRNTTKELTPEALAEEQLHHFGIDPATDYGRVLGDLATSLYRANVSTHDLWRITIETLASLDKSDRIAWFNSKRFVCFQLAKILDNLQNPLRTTYQSISTRQGGFASKGPYPLFDNVTALFSATPVITRTATYLFACTEWIEDAFKGREPLHEIYSRLLNPTSISLANHMIDLECGERAGEYMAWNFNSGMAAIDCLFAHMLGHRDILLAGRNVYGGTHQLLHDWYHKKSNLDMALEWVDGPYGSDYKAALDALEIKYADRLAEGRQIYVFIESPCNPHGTVLDVSGIARVVHEKGLTLMCDSTVGTPFLHPVMKREDPMERPDFVVHSYTKDLSGSGATTAGVVIARNERMFMPKGDRQELTCPDGHLETINWDETMFWNVYYVKGAFLDADKAFEVLNGMRTYEMRVLNKAINTIVLARILAQHPHINVNCGAIPGHPNAKLMQQQMLLGLPAPLFTIDMEGDDSITPMGRTAFKRFYDSLEPAIGMQVSLGQTNTAALCPALTTHSELSEEDLKEAGIAPTTMRISVGLEDPRILISHIQRSAMLTLDTEIPGFSQHFPPGKEIDRIYRETYVDVHSRYVASLPDYSFITT